MDAPQNIRHIARQYRTRSSTGIQGSKQGIKNDLRLSSDPFRGLFRVSYPYFFLGMSLLAIYLYSWPIDWWKSGAPLVSFSLMTANLSPLNSNLPLLVASLLYVNLTYVVCSTSWLLLRCYRIAAVPTIACLSLSTNKFMQKYARRLLRFVLRSAHFCDDKLAFFDLPGLDIDTGDVPCLLVIRGFTFTLSTMTLEVHGVEVGVRLSDEIELAIQTDKFTWRIFREISIGDVYGNLKSTPNAARVHNLKLTKTQKESIMAMSNEKAPDEVKASESVGQQMTSHGDSDVYADNAYKERVQQVSNTNTIHRAYKRINSDIKDENEIKAAAGSRIHNDKAVPNPPKKQMKSSALVNRVPWIFKEAFRRCPVLLRMFLNPVSYNHPVHFKSIVLTGCGKYVNALLEEYYFKSYPEENKELKKLKDEIDTFLTKGKLNVVLPHILGLASVPFLTHYDILTFVKAPEVLIYQTIEKDEHGNDIEVVEELARLEGVAATFSIPSALLPHHDDLLPPPPQDVNEPDCLNVKMSILGSLPGKFHQSMVEFAITMLKCSQVLTLQKNATSMSDEVETVADFSKSVGKAFKEQTKKKLVEAHIDDAWLTKLLHQAVKAFRTAQGDVGYQTDIPVDLTDLRPKTYVSRTATSQDPSLGKQDEFDASRRSSTMSHTSTGSRDLADH